ncbi:PA14 domain-containing protein, partial [Pontibacter cellulosilyticus]
NNSVDNNTVGITAWGYANNRNDVSVAEAASFSNNTFLPAGAVPVSTEASEYTLWTQKLQQNGIVIGPNGTSGSTTTTNQAPNVTLTSPASGAAFTAGNTITLTASASDADGTVARVEFFAGSTKIGESTASPYSFNWASVAAGSYSLTAKATDDKGATKVSAAVSISVATATTSTVTTTTTTGTGKISREYWANVSGSGIANIPLTSAPTSVTDLTSLEAPTNVADNYGQRIRGYVTAPESGQYTFWVAGDNSAELWLSTSEDPAGKVKLASVSGWTNPREWGKYTTQQSVKVSLQAGKRYYIEALMKEENGGDNLAVAWQLPSGATEAPIAGSRLSQLGSTATSTTTTQPAPTTTTTTTTGTGKISREYWANVSGSGIANIPLTSAPTSVTDLTSLEAPTNVADNYGQRIRGYVTAPESGQYTFWVAGDNSAELWLSTSEDPAGKVKLASVSGWTNPREWGKYTTQQSVKVSLQAGKRYYIEALMKEENGGDNLAVAWQLPSGATEAPIAGSRLSQLGSTATSTTTTQPAPTTTTTTIATGKITREFWANVNTESISQLPLTNTPTSVTELTVLETPSNIGDNYGQRVRGYIIAPESGQYTFWIAGDNNAELWLSTSTDPAGKVKLAYVNGWTNPREYTKYTTQQSVRVTLEAGKAYYVEVLHAEVAGGDNLSVSWQLPSGAKEAPIAGKHLAPISATLGTISTLSSSVAGDDVELTFEGTTAYPNPFRDMITLDFGDKEVTLQRVVLVNQAGKVVYEEKGNLELVNNKLEINLSNAKINSGLYFLTYTDAQGKTDAIKVIKE